MKQLLHCHKNATILAFHDRAFVYLQNSKTVFELSPVECTRKDLQENPIQAVAIHQDDNRVIWSAVTRADKTLSIYQLGNNTDSDTTLHPIGPITIHNTPKRVGCMCFARVQQTTTVIAGDFTGDAWAFSLHKAGQQRFLLGHTASMLTGIYCHKNLLLTADRDEKIRITNFPDTTIIQGFLLGHAAYVSSMDIHPNKNLCVSCSGGDGTVRLWDFLQAKHLDTWSCNSINNDEDNNNNSINKKPCRVAIHPQGTHVVVIYDQSSTMDLLNLQQDESGKTTLAFLQTIQFADLPLNISFTNDSHLLVLTKDPAYLQVFQPEPDKDTYQELTTELPEGLAVLQKLAQEHKLTMPDSVLEKDQQGQIKLEKIAEARGGANAPEEKRPWNRTERIEVAKQRNKRHKKRRAERQKQEKQQKQKQQKVE